MAKRSDAVRMVATGEGEYPAATAPGRDVVDVVLAAPVAKRIARKPQHARRLADVELIALEGLPQQVTLARRLFLDAHK